MGRAIHAVSLFCLAAVVVLVCCGPASANLTGAVWTTAADGQKVNANLYDQKCPPSPDPCVVPPLVPFLNGGPNFASPTRWVPDGFYYFQVTDPPGKTLLSCPSEDIAARKFRVWTDGTGRKHTEYPLADNPDPHITCQDSLSGNITIALGPMLDTPNNGGVYKLWITRVSDYNPSDPQAKLGFIPSCSKTDNFKVKKLASVWGNKVDDQGDPLEGLHVILYKVVKVKGQDTLQRIGDTCTDGNGEFSFSNLLIGKYAVDEDLPGTDNPTCCLNPVDYSGYERVSPLGRIYFQITKGNLGGKNGPGTPIFIGTFVNKPPTSLFAELAGLKFLDVDGDGDWDVAAEMLLGDWVITLEEKTGNGSWRQARYADDTLVEPVVTGPSGTYDFGNLPAAKVYRICEFKWVDLDEDGYLLYDDILHPETDYTYDGATYTFGGELVKADDAGWLQTAPSLGDPGPYAVVPIEAEDDVAVDVVNCDLTNDHWCFVVELSGAAPDETLVSSLRFGNKLGSICVQKLQAVTETELQGWKFNLYADAACTILAEDGFGNPVPEITTGPDGTACWSNLLAGTYWVKETLVNGWVPVDPVSGVTMVTVDAGEEVIDPPVAFYNRAICIGHTPGFWRNWDVGQPGVNHPTPEEFAMLLEGTIADGDIATANAILDKWDNAPGDEVGHLSAFVLAIELTLNLTQHPELPYSTTCSLVPECVLPGVEGNLGWWLDEALDILDAGGVGYTREYITLVAGVLDAFCNANMP